VRTIRTGRNDHETVEVYDNKTCPDCGALLVSPHVLLSSVGCPEDGHHRTIRCVDCGHVMLEPPCDAEQGGSLYDPDNRPAH
jgi:ribosomal protein S27E